MTQPSEPRTKAGRALLTILRHRAQVARTEPCMAALIGAVDDAVRMLPKIEAEASAVEITGDGSGTALAEAAVPDPVASPAEALRAALERLAHYADAAATCFYPQEGKERCDHRPILRDEVARARRYLEGAVASPAPLDADRLARALIESDLMPRYREYAMRVPTMNPSETVEHLAGVWAGWVAAAYALEGQPVAEEGT